MNSLLHFGKLNSNNKRLVLLWSTVTKEICFKKYQDTKKNKHGLRKMRYGEFLFKLLKD
jgi:hypothetical protein